jgi:hypothetical protein
MKTFIQFIHERQSADQSGTAATDATPSEAAVESQQIDPAVQVKETGEYRGREIIGSDSSPESC